MASKVPILTFGQLSTLHTGSLLTRLRKLQECEESVELSDRCEHEVATDCIEFKNTSEWREAYAQLKAILAKREHLPTSAERLAKREERVIRAKSSERRKRT